MNTFYLKYAIEVENTGSITKAAENLYMSQPNLSKAIRELENDMGIEIFKRSPKGVEPTEKGAEFLRYARRIAAQIDQMQELYQKSGGNEQRLSIAVPRGSYIANAFTRFARTLDMDKGISLYFLETNSMRAIAGVADREYDMGIIRYQKTHEDFFQSVLADKGLQGREIWTFEYLALMPQSHPLAGREKVEYEELCKSIEITHGDTDVPFLTFKGTKSPQGSLAPAKRIYVFERGSQFDLLTSIPNAFMWVSPVPETTLMRYNLVQRRCDVANHFYKDMLIFSEGYEFTPLDTAFLKLLFKVRDEVSSKEYV